MEQTGNLIGVGDCRDDAKLAAAASTDGDVDGEHAGEKSSPRDARRGAPARGRVSRANRREACSVEHRVLRDKDALPPLAIGRQRRQIDSVFPRIVPAPTG